MEYYVENSIIQPKTCRFFQNHHVSTNSQM